MSRIKVDAFKCERCDHIWCPRSDRDKKDNPKTCPKCHSPYWDTPRR